MKNVEINRVGNTRFVNIPGVGVGMYSGMVGTFSAGNLSKTWEVEPEIVSGKEVVPYGVDNNLPSFVRDMLDENNLAPGILEREKGLLYGQGPELYKKVYENGEVIREWGSDAKIWEWLESWDYLRYIEMAITEYKYLHGYFVKHFPTRGKRIGKEAKIARLEVIPGVNARLGWVDSRKLEDVREIYVGDFENNCISGIATYPVYDKNDPFRTVSISYHNSYSYARSLYSIPSFWGSRNWIMRSSDVPQVLKYITENSINVAFHIESPAEYWDIQKDKIEQRCTRIGIEYNDEMLEEHKDEVLRSLANALSGKKNVGKFFHTISLKDDEGKIGEWKITPIDQKIKDFIEAQIRVSEKADSATTSGIGLHPALSNIMVDGKLSSGSEMLYALKLYLASDTTIPEEIILQALNETIRLNFPGTPWRVGFYHKIVLREEDVAPKDRVKQNV